METTVLAFGGSVRVLLGMVLLTLAAAAPLGAQGLEDRLTDLFIFGTGDEVLVLGGSAAADNPAIQVHGNHFVPSAVGGNATIISFLSSAISTNITNIPFSSTGGGETFRFEGATPVRTSISAGPIYAERAQTLGRGRLFAGLARSGLHYTTLRGIPLDDVAFTFAHSNVDFPACDAIFAGDCTVYGVPTFENETIDFRLDLDVSVDVTALLLTYGISDRIDFGVVLPFVSTDLRGTSTATTRPLRHRRAAAALLLGHRGEPRPHRQPLLRGLLVRPRRRLGARQDQPARGHAGLARHPRRRPLPDRQRGGSARLRRRGAPRPRHRLGAAGGVLPHVNVGYLYRGRFVDNDAFLLTAGFDQLLAPWATLAGDLITEFQVGTSRLTVPSDVVLEAPFRRTVRASSIPERRDDIVNASLGTKLSLPQRVTFLANAVFPLNRGGMRPDVLWTLGAEYTF